MSYAGRLCEEKDCCEWGDLNWCEAICVKCDIEFIPAREHEKDNNNDNRYQNYYGSNDDEGDICYKCLCKLNNQDRE